MGRYWLPFFGIGSYLPRSIVLPLSDIDSVNKGSRCLLEFWLGMLKQDFQCDMRVLLVFLLVGNFLWLFLVSR